MASKKEKKGQKGNDGVDPRTLPPQVLAARARAALGEEKFQVAIDMAKHLLLRLPGEEAKLLLRQAYSGRARQLAAKGMFKEAHVVWENMGKVCGGGEDLDRPIAWLINGGEPVKAAQALGAVGEERAATPLAEAIVAHLAALTVAGRDDVRAALPLNSPLALHYPALASALAAYDRGDRDATLGHLKQIPFRSPYRDCTYILRGLLEIDAAPDKALDSFLRPGKDSPFASLGRVLAASLAGPEARSGIMAMLSKQEKAIWAELTGVNSRQLRLLTEGGQVAPADLLTVILALSGNLGPEETRRLCLQTLPFFPQGMSAVEKQIGRLSEVDKLRIAALHDELSRERHADPLFKWQMVIAALKKEGRKNGNALRIALVYRHMAALAERMGEHELDGVDALHLLWQSLDYDPADRETYRKLLERQSGDTKMRQEVAERALSVFPREVEFLLAAAEAACARSAFKKAVGLAERVLQVDPIHVRANALIVEAGLSHGRKQAKSGKHHLAAKEFAAALQRERPGLQSGVPHIVAGLHAVAYGESSAGEALLAEGQRNAGGGVKAALVTLVEAEQLSLPSRLVKRFAEGVAQAVLGPITVADLLGVIGQLEWYQARSIPMRNYQERVLPYFKKAAALPFGRDEVIFLCDFFMKQELYPLLDLYAASGLKQCPGHPRLLYYAIFARLMSSRRGQLRDQEIVQLKDAALRAFDAGDLKTTEMIVDFVDYEETPEEYPPPVTASEESRRAIAIYFDEVMAERARDKGRARPSFDDEEEIFVRDGDIDLPSQEDFFRLLHEATKRKSKKKKKGKPPMLPF